MQIKRLLITLVTQTMAYIIFVSLSIWLLFMGLNRIPIWFTFVDWLKFYEGYYRDMFTGFVVLQVLLLTMLFIAWVVTIYKNLSALKG